MFLAQHCELNIYSFIQPAKHAPKAEPKLAAQAHSTPLSAGPWKRRERGSKASNIVSKITDTIGDELMIHYPSMDLATQSPVQRGVNCLSFPGITNFVGHCAHCRVPVSHSSQKIVYIGLSE